MERNDAWPDQAFWRGFRLRFVFGVLATFGVLGVWLATLPAANSGG